MADEQSSASTREAQPAVAVSPERVLVTLGALLMAAIGKPSNTGNDRPAESQLTHTSGVRAV